MLVVHLMTSINVLTFQKSECDHEYEELWKESGIRKSCSALLIMWITNTYKKRDCYDQFQLHPVRAPATERLILFSLSAMVQYPLDVFKVRASSVFLHTICSFENASHIKSVVHWTHLIQFTSDSCLLFFVIILVLIFFLIDICANTDAPQGTVLAPFIVLIVYSWVLKHWWVVSFSEICRWPGRIIPQAGWKVCELVW